jgi:5'-3' exonuclease
MEDLALLVDSKNAMYRAIYAIKAQQERAKRGGKTIRPSHSVVVLLRQITGWMREFKPTSVHLFFDAPRDSVWRRSVLDTYKDRSKSQYVENISEDLKECITISRELFKYLNVRMYYKDKMEADDLIFAAAAIRHPRKSIVISTDSDMLQIPFMFNSCQVYNPSDAKMVDVPKINPAISKALIGDTSDNIAGYYGIGPKKGEVLLEDHKKLHDFFSFKGREIFKRNLLLTDLMLNPKLLANKMYVLREATNDVNFDKKNVIEIANKYNIHAILTEFADLIYPFEKIK